MASKIRSAPVLSGKEAKRFVETADHNLINKGTIDWSKEYAEMLKITKKAQLKNIELKKINPDIGKLIINK